MPDAFVARQPIFNDKLDVVGYELLFRGSGYLDEADYANAEQATATVVLNSLTELDLDRIVGTKRAWVNVSREFVLDGLAQAIPSGLVGLEVPHHDLESDQMLSALGQLKANGYRLALDGFAERPELETPLELFDVIKLNMAELGRERFSEQLARLKGFSGQVLAEKVATHPDHAYCVNAGCDLFQGYFFCRPAVVCTKGIATNRLALLQVVAALHKPGVELADVEKLVAHDVALSLRLLRYVNSAYFGLRCEVRSVGQALALLGIENVKRWAALSALASIDDKPTELTVTALVRARFCELAGSQMGIADESELFTLGLFSVIDAMLDAPMHDVVASLPFSAEMREALTARKGPRGRLLESVAALETGEYTDARLLVPAAGRVYVEALMWATDAADSLLGKDRASDQEPNGEPARPAPPARAAVDSKPPPGLEPRHGSEAASAPPPAITASPAAAPDTSGKAIVSPAAVPAPAGFFRRLWARLTGRRAGA